MAFYAGAPQRCRQGWQSAGTPSSYRRARPPNPRAEFRICSCGGCSSRPPFDARRCCTLAGRHSGGRYASTDRVCQNSPRSLFSRHLRSLKKNKCGCPPGPQPYPHGVGWVTAGTQCEGVPLVGAHPLPPCPAVLQGWTHRRDGGGVLRPSRDRPEARRRARRREHQGHPRVRLPRRPVRRRSVGGGPTAPAPSGRATALHIAAYNGYTKSAVALLVGGADQTVTDNAG